MFDLVTRNCIVVECEAVDRSAANIINGGTPVNMVKDEMQRQKNLILTKYL